MTCDELREQVADLNGQIEAIDTEIASYNTNANSQYSGVLLNDSYGGTYPDVPITLTAAQARYAYLMGKMPPVAQAVTNVYQSIIGLLSYVTNTLQPTRAQKVTEVESFQQQMVEQNC